MGRACSQFPLCSAETAAKRHWKIESLELFCNWILACSIDGRSTHAGRMPIQGQTDYISPSEYICSWHTIGRQSATSQSVRIGLWVMSNDIRMAGRTSDWTVVMLSPPVHLIWRARRLAAIGCRTKHSWQSNWCQNLVVCQTPQAMSCLRKEFPEAYTEWRPKQYQSVMRA